VTESILICGAGLVGSLEAIFLARRGFDVSLHERLPDMRRERIAAGRSINLAISARGLHALAQVGLEAEALAHAIPMRGRTMHARDGGLSFQAYGKDDSQHINSISRAWLNQLLMTAAEATGRVHISFLRPFAPEDAEGRVLIGADGGGSAVRQHLQREIGERFALSQEFLGHGYKELSLPDDQGSWRLAKHSLHIWPRGSYMLIALPNEDGSFTCTLFLPHAGAPSFESLRTPADVTAFFEEEFPDALRLIPDLTEQFFANPTGQLGTIKAWPWASGESVLMGDAAHAVVPFYGQGMNCGFEDCVVLDRLLEGRPAGGPFAPVFEAFARARKPQSDSIADMAVENFVEMRDLTADPRFLLEKAIEKRLLLAFPDEFYSRYTLVSFSLAPYRFARQLGEIASGIVRDLCVGVTTADDVDLGRARQLIAQRLTPFLAENEDGFRP